MNHAHSIYLLTLAGSTTFGIVIGSFLNVVIYRVPLHMSISRPGSHCTNCKTLLSPFDNIPIASWIFLRQRCRYCHEKISIRYPLVELTTGLLFLATALITGTSIILPGLLVTTGASIAIIAIELDGLEVSIGIAAVMFIGSLMLATISVAHGSLVPLLWVGISGVIAGSIAFTSTTSPVDLPVDLPVDSPVDSPEPINRTHLARSLSILSLTWSAGLLWIPGGFVCVASSFVWKLVDLQRGNSTTTLPTRTQEIDQVMDGESKHQISNEPKSKRWGGLPRKTRKSFPILLIIDYALVLASSILHFHKNWF